MTENDKKPEKGKEFPRETYRIVQHNKQKLQKLLKKWGEENKIPNEQETLNLEYLWDTATLGFADRIKMGDQVPGWENFSLCKVKNEILQTEQEKIQVGYSHKAEYERPIIQIGELWKALLKRLNEAVFDKALGKALEVTPEREIKNGKTKSSPRG